VKGADIGPQLILSYRPTVRSTTFRGADFSMEEDDYIFHDVDLIFRIEVRHFNSVDKFTAKLDWEEYEFPDQSLQNIALLLLLYIYICYIY
jgi:hypothetical protein